MRRRESCRWTTRPSTPGGPCTLARFGPTASSIWFGARKSRCGRSPILTHDRMRSGRRFLTVCIETWGGWANPGPRGAVAWGWKMRRVQPPRRRQGLTSAAIGTLAQPAESNGDAFFSPLRSGTTSHDLAIGFVCTVQDQHHDPVGDLVSVPLVDPLRRADGHHLLPVQRVVEENRSSRAAGDLRRQDHPARDFYPRAPRRPECGESIPRYC